MKNKIKEFLSAQPADKKFTAGQVARGCKTSNSTAFKLLSELIVAGEVEKTKEENTNYYSLVSFSLAPQPVAAPPKIILKSASVGMTILDPAAYSVRVAANDEVIITRSEAQSILGLSRPGWYRARDLDGFPKEIKYGGGYPRYKKSEVIAFREKSTRGAV